MKINVIEDGHITEREMTEEEIADIYEIKEGEQSVG